MDTLRSRMTLSLSVVASLFLVMSCASSVPLASERVDHVPAGHYRVIISESPSGGQRYNAVLFEAEAASVILDAPTVQRGRDTAPADYEAAMRSGFVVYEIRGIAGTVQAYLMVPPHAQVRVWDRPVTGGGLTVTVSDVSGSLESGGGGGGGM